MGHITVVLVADLLSFQVLDHASYSQASQKFIASSHKTLDVVEMGG